MKVNVTIPDGPFADSLITEAAKRNQSEASLIAAYARTMLNKYGYKIEPQAKIRRGDDGIPRTPGRMRLHVRANASQAKD